MLSPVTGDGAMPRRPFLSVAVPGPFQDGADEVGGADGVDDADGVGGADGAAGASTVQSGAPGAGFAGFAAGAATTVFEGGHVGSPAAAGFSGWAVSDFAGGVDVTQSGVPAGLAGLALGAGVPRPGAAGTQSLLFLSSPSSARMRCSMSSSFFAISSLPGAGTGIGTGSDGGADFASG